MTDISVLIIVGLRAGSVNRELTEAAADSSTDGIALNMFESLTDLPGIARRSTIAERRVLSEPCARPPQRPTRCSL